MADIYTMTLPDGTLCNMRDSRVDTIPGTVENIVDLIYPVGSIFINMTNADPNLLFEGTEWIQINGRFLVAQGSNGETGNNLLNLPAGDTGGERVHTLQADESGTTAHTHGGDFTRPTVSSSGAATNAITGGGHTHATSAGYSFLTANGNVSINQATARDQPSPKSGGWHYVYSTSSSVGINEAANTASNTHTHNLPNHTHTLTGGGFKVANAQSKEAAAAHENLPPYLAVYMWQRIA